MNLERLCEHCSYNKPDMDGDICSKCEETLNSIEQELQEGKKNKRVLELIKEKKVDVVFIIENPEAKDVFWYNSSFTGVLCEGWRMLSQEEYDSIRKVLLCAQQME